MDDITLLQECMVKVEEEEHCDTYEYKERDMLGNNSLLQVKTERSTIDSPVFEQNDSEEEEMKPLAAVYLKTDEGTEEQNSLAVDPLAGCEVRDEKKALTDVLLWSVKKEELAETEEDAGTSNGRCEQVTTEKMDDADYANDTNTAEFPTEEHASKPDNKDIRRYTNRMPFACIHCSETFQYKKTLKEHERKHRDGSQLVTCDTCQQQFTARSALVNHTRIHMNKAEKKKKFPCETCGKEFKSGCYLQIHLRLHTGEKPCVCDHCGRRFTDASTLSVHRRKHTGVQPYSCSICNKRFAHKSTLVKHTRRHLNIKPYECKVCQKTFVQSSEYAVHLRVHTGEKPFKCSICPKTFSLLGNLKRHTFTHNREPKQMSECEVCSESFRTTYMKRHMRTHRREKRHKCRFCKATFSQLSVRLRHEDMHSQSDRKVVQCKECGKSLSSPEHLKVHMRCHTGEKPFKCGYCEKTFAQSTNRRTHEVTHTKEYRYNCAECGMGYIKKRDLVSHILRHEN